MNKIQKFELLLDNVISEIAKTKVSQVSGLGHCEPHHLIRRFNKLFRWDLQNIMFITRAEHFNIHSNGVDYCNYKQHLFIAENKNKGLREYLQNNNLTYTEFLETAEQNAFFKKAFVGVYDPNEEEPATDVKAEVEKDLGLKNGKAESK